MLPLILAALGAGALRSAFGVAKARHDARDAEKLVEHGYTLASGDLQNRQRDIAQSRGESLASRGLIGSAMVGNASGPTDLASQDQSTMQQSFGRERENLLLQHDSAIRRIKSGATNDALGAFASGINTGSQVYGMGKMASAMTGSPSVPGGGGGSGLAGAWGLDPVNALDTPGVRQHIMGSSVAQPGTANYNNGLE